MQTASGIRWRRREREREREREGGGRGEGRGMPASFGISFSLSRSLSRRHISPLRLVIVLDLENESSRDLSACEALRLSRTREDLLGQGVLTRSRNAAGY